MENFKKIAEIIVYTPEASGKIKEILKDVNVSVVDEGMRLVIIEKNEQGE